MNIKDRLIKLREDNHWSKAYVARELHMPYTTYNNYERGASGVNSDVLRDIARLYHVTTDYLLGVNNKFSDSFNNSEVSIYTPELTGKNQKRAVPIIGSVSAGNGELIKEDISGYVTIDDSRIDCILRVNGTSMEPTLPQGSLAYIDRSGDVHEKDIVIAIVDDTAYMKRYYINGEMVTLRPDNINYDILTFNAKDVNIYGCVRYVRIEL